MKIPESDLQDAQLREMEEQYRSGQMGRREASDAVMFLMEQEMMKPGEQIDWQRLEACAALLREVDRRQLRRMARRVEARRTASGGENATPPRRFWAKPALALALGMVLLLGFGIGGRHFARFRGTQEEDGQTYHIEGEGVTIGEPATAKEEAEDGGMQYCDTKDFGEACAFLGMEPPMPTWLPDGWELYQYALTKFSGRQDFLAYYQKEGNEYFIVYSYEDVKDIEHFAMNIPQDGEGESIVLPNGQAAYYTTNIGRSMILWIQGNIVSSISGPIPYDELLRMVLSIGE